MFLFYFLLSCIASAHFIKTQNTQRGVYTTVVAYDSRHLTNEINYIYANKTGNTLYVIAITKGVANTVVCRETVTTPIIIAPRGCDNRDESVSVLRTNCGHKTVLGITNYWSYSKLDDVCLRAGSTATCLGPVYLFSTNSPFRPSLDDDWALLQGAYVTSGVGPSCAIPALTRVDVKMPSLKINSTCSFIVDGIYEVDIQENQRGYFNFRLGINTIEIKPNVALRVARLGVITHVTTQATMDVVYIPFNTTCTYKLSLVAAPRPLELQEPEIPTTFNYFKKTLVFNTQLTCNWGVSRLDFDTNRPVWGGIPENVLHGGKLVPKTKNGIPVEFIADPAFSDFYPDCDRFYPKSTTFNGYGFTGFDGPSYNRFEQAIFTCFAPFPYPERIIEIGTLEERAKQCHMLGGVVSTRTFDVCAMDSWRTYCRFGWIYFDTRCWYMPNPEKDALYQVAAGVDSEIVCKNLHPFAISTYPITAWTSAWLQRFFVYWKHPGVVVRINIAGNRCECYSIARVSSCACEDPIFPLCSYNIKNDFLTWTYTNYHPETLQLFKYGQQGLPHDGTEFTCECEPGWTGSRCDKATCVPPVLATPTFNTSINNPQLTFFKRCYFNNRGYCVDDFVYQCQCVKGYGPPGDLLNDLYTTTPCTCPALSKPSPIERLIAIDNVLTPNLIGVCGFLFRGRCVTEGWNQATCHCRYRWARGDVREPAYMGKTCGCRTTHYTPGLNSVTESTCNNHGTCCPHGEREDGTTGYCPVDFDGCYCDDGWAGEACTSRIPYSAALNHPLVTIEATNLLYARQKNRYAVEYVYLYTAQVGLTVQVVDTIDGVVLATCNRIEFEDWETRDSQKYTCSGTIGWYIKVNDALVTLRVTNTDYSICGHHVNTKAARYYELAQFVQPENTTELICAFHIPDPAPLQYPFDYDENYVRITLDALGPVYYVYITNPTPSLVLNLANGTTCTIFAYDTWETILPNVTKYFCGGIVSSYLAINTTNPTAINVQVLLDDFTLCAQQSNDVVDEYQVFRFAKYGSTTGSCLCKPGFVGPLCNVGISAWRLSETEASWTYRQCGDSTQPKRGYATEDACTCESIGDVIVFQGNACECAIVDGQVCSNHGTCEPTSFPEGRCSFDQDVLQNDPLSTPYRQNKYGYTTYRAWNESTFMWNGIQWAFKHDDVFVMRYGFGHINRCINLSNVSLSFTEEYQPTHDNLTLSPGEYVVTIQCMYAVFQDTSTLIQPDGAINCADPIDRMIDSTLDYPQCYYPTFYHNTGLGFGLFHNLTFQVDFTDDDWTIEHYKLIASVTNYKRCDDFTIKDWDTIVGQLTTNRVAEYTTTSAQLLPTKFTRKVIVTSAVDLSGVILYSPSNATCAIYANIVPANTAVEIYCLCQEGCNRLSAIDEPDFYNFTVQSWYRNTSYHTVFQSIHESIQRDHQFPSLGIERCNTNPTLNFTNTTDQQYLLHFYETKLAMRSCSNNLHCQQFYPTAVCVYDNINTKHVPWLNGGTLSDVAFGNEGGCECRTDTSGFFALETFCSSCVLGYGPETDFQFRSLYAMMDKIPNFIDSDIPIRACTLPIDTSSTRPTTVCGGRGYVRRTHEATQIYTSVVKNTIKRCKYLSWNGLEYQVVDADAAHVDLQSFKSGTRLIHMIHNKVFYNGTEIFDYTCIQDGGLVSFVSRLVDGQVVGIKKRSYFTMWFN